MKKTYYLYADFETTQVKLPDKYKSFNEYYDSDINAIKPKIYSWCVLYSSEYGKLNKSNFDTKNFNGDIVNLNIGIDGNSFIKFIEKLDKDYIIYFNNLKGFDGHFIIPLLDKLGYKNVLPFDIQKYTTLDNDNKKQFTRRILDIKNELFTNYPSFKKAHETIKKIDPDKAKNMLANRIKKMWSRLLPGEYSVIANGNNQIYEIKIGLECRKKNGKGNTNRAVIIRDNMLLFPSSIKRMGESLVKQLEKKSKLSKKELENIYLKKDLSSNYKVYELYKSVKQFKNDGNEYDYLIQDTFILWKYHKMMENFLPRKDWKLTIGATTYNEWIKDFGEELSNKTIESGKAEIIELERGVQRVKYKNRIYNTKKFKEFLIKKLIPVDFLDQKISDYELTYDRIYKYYGGGITHLNEQYRGQLVDNITFIDINSSYPSQQVKDIEVPYGRPKKGDHKDYPFKFYKLIPKKKIVNKFGLPFMWNSLSDKREYLKILKPYSIYYLTSITYERFKKYYTDDTSAYDLEVEFSFKSIPINTYFNSFVSKWYEKKETAALNGNIVLKEISKLFLNNLYGKYGTKISRTSRYWNQFSTEWDTYNQTLDSNYYLPIAIVIAEMGRMNLVDAVDDNYNDFVYCDTDSLAIINFKAENYKNVKLHYSKIGYWDIEYENMYGIFRRTKQYFLLDGKGKTKLVFSGINFHKFLMSDKEEELVSQYEKMYRNVSLKDFILGKTIDNQLTPNRILGSGILFQNIEKTIKPVWDYNRMTEQIYYLPEHFKNSLEKIKLKKVIKI